MKEQTKKEIQQKLADYRQPAPEVSWAELEKALAANRKAKAVVMWPKRLAAAAVVLLMVGFGWHLFKTESTRELSQTAKVETTIPMIQKSVQNPTDQQTTDKTVVEKLITSVKTRMAAVAVESQTDGNMPITAQETYGEPATVEKQEPVADETSAHNGEPTKVEKPKLEPQRSAFSKDFRQPNRSYERRLTAQVYMSNSMSGSISANAITPQMRAANTYGTNEKEFEEVNGVLLEQQTAIDEHIDHHQPVRFGVSVRYQLSNRWSVESGLMYSYLSSDITRKTNGYSYDINQKLSYVGVPVGVNYQLLSSKRLGVYASAGGIVEKMVKGSQTSQTVVNGQKEPEHTEDVSIRPLQVSLTCGVGVEYKADRILSIYAEPGLTYHFDNHSVVPTFYQDKPLGFNLNVGLRFNIGK